MDLVTHAMTGLLVGSAAANRKTKLYPALLTGALAAAILDLDTKHVEFVKLDGPEWKF